MKIEILWELRTWLSKWEKKRVHLWVNGFPGKGKWTANQDNNNVFSVTVNNGIPVRYLSLEKIMGNPSGDLDKLKKENHIQQMDDSKALKRLSDDFYKAVGEEYRGRSTAGGITKLKYQNFCRYGTMTIDSEVVKEREPMGDEEQGNWGCSDFKQVETIARDSVRGGLTYANQTGILDCKHYDIRSSYPYIMCQDLPYGGPVDPSNYKKDETVSLIYPIARLMKMEHQHMPILHWSGIAEQLHYCGFPMGAEFPNRIDLDGTHPIWEEEWELMKKHYRCKIEDEFYRVVTFKKQTNEYLKDYITELARLKKKAKKDTMTYSATKVLLNSLYGKTIQKPIAYSKVYDDNLEPKIVQQDTAPWYTPAGSYIVMKGRVNLVKAIDTIPIDKFIYCDTDSVFCTLDTKFNFEDRGQLGDWENDGQSILNMIGPKTYQELKPDGHVVNHVAGLSSSTLPYIEFGDLKPGYSVEVVKEFRDEETWIISKKPTMFTVRS